MTVFADTKVKRWKKLYWPADGVMVRLPARFAVPVTVTKSEPDGATSITSVEPAANVRLPFTASVPMELPGDTVEPDCAINDPTVPFPPNVDPLCSVIVDLASEPTVLFSLDVDPLCSVVIDLAGDPAKLRRPAVTVVVPVKLFTPVRVKVPAPDLISEPVPEIAPAKLASVV